MSRRVTTRSAAIRPSLHAARSGASLLEPEPEPEGGTLRATHASTSGDRSVNPVCCTPS
jgi:hypothetical protein